MRAFKRTLTLWLPLAAGVAAGSPHFLRSRHAHESANRGWTLSGVVFFDLNGNGKRETNEPPVAGATVQVSGRSAVTGADGRYKLENLTKGFLTLSFSAGTGIRVMTY